jgi:hypothetical protein
MSYCVVKIKSIAVNALQHRVQGASTSGTRPGVRPLQRHPRGEGSSNYLLDNKEISQR